jgi:Tol biopolymer transport system component
MSNDNDGSARERSQTDDVRFDSWKDIATYLNRGVTTVQRWEREEGLPVRRQEHLKKGSVFALKSELDAWRASRERRSLAAAADSTELAPAAEPVPPPARLGFGWRGAVFAVISLALTALALSALSARRVSGTAEDPAAPPAARPFANDAASETSATFAPDGEAVAYLWRRETGTGIYIKSVAGGPPRLVDTGTFSFVGSAYLRWSPRGDYLAFLSGEDSTSRGVFIVPIRGGAPRRLTAISGIGLCWWPDGESLGIVDRTATSEPFAVFRLIIASGERQRLTVPPGGTFGDTLCSVSPDGQHIAVARYADRYQSDLFVVSVANPTDATRVTVDFGGVNGLTWSPDGSDMFVGAHDGLYRVPWSSGIERPVLIAAAGVTVHSPSTARTAAGQVRITYQSSIRDVNLYRWRADAGRDVVDLFAGSSAWDTHPAFSADGQRVAFVSNRTGFHEVWVTSAHGGEAVQVTHHRGPVLASPQFSPDGERIAFTSHRQGNRDIYVIRTDGSRSTRLTWEPTQERNPTWSRDGQWIYFSSDRGGVNRLWKVAASGGSPVPVTRGEATQGFESLDGSTLYFMRSTDTPGLWKMPVAGGEESAVPIPAAETYWGVTTTGVVYLVPSSEIARGPSAIHSWEALTGRTETLLHLPPGAGPVTNGFAATPDGKSLLWVQYERMQNDVMLIDDWRR